MKNLSFNKENKAKILSREKTLTARCRKIKPPEPGEIITASTGGYSGPRFAKLLVTETWIWYGRREPQCQKPYLTYSQEEIAKREGFESWDDFMDVYDKINFHRYHQKGMTHWFIGFKLIEVLEP